MIDGIQFDYFNYLFDYLEQEFVQGVKAFEEIFSANPIEDWKLDFSERIHYESCITEYITTKKNGPRPPLLRVASAAMGRQKEIYKEYDGIDGSIR